MTDPGAIELSCSDVSDFSRSFGSVRRASPPDMAQRLDDVFMSYFARCGIEVAYQRMNDRTVSQIFAEYRPGDEKPIASGEVDGVRYELYGAPRPDTQDHGD